MYSQIHGGAPKSAAQILVKNKLPKGGKFGNMTSQRFDSFGGHRYVPGHILRDNAHHSLGMKYEEEKVQRGWVPSGGSFTKSMSLRFDGPGSYTYNSRRLLDARDLRKQRKKDRTNRTQETSRARRSRSPSPSPRPSSRKNGKKTERRGRSSVKKKERRTRGRSPTYKRFFPEPKSPAKTLWRRRRDHSSVSSSSSPSSASRNSSGSSGVRTAGTKAAAARLRDRNLQERMKNSFRFAKKRWNRTNVPRRQIPSTPSVMDIASAELEEFERSPQEVENKKEGSFVRTIEKKKKAKKKKVLFQGLRSEKVAKLIGEKMNYDTKPGVAMFIPVSGYEGAPVRVVKIEEEEEVEEVGEVEEEESEEEELPPPIPAATTQEEEEEEQQKKEITDEEFTSNLLSRNRSASFGWSSLMDRINQKMGGL